jgi:hypothetical protein
VWLCCWDLCSPRRAHPRAQAGQRAEEPGALAATAPALLPDGRAPAALEALGQARRRDTAGAGGRSGGGGTGGGAGDSATGGARSSGGIGGGECGDLADSELFSKSIEGTWDFTPKAGTKRSIQVPGGGWLKQGINASSGTYATQITVPDSGGPQTTLIEFSAINFQATLSVDGKQVATNTTTKRH